MVQSGGRKAYQIALYKIMWTNILEPPDEVRDAIRGLKVGKAPGPNGIPNRILKHLPMRAVLLLVQIFNAILRTHHLKFLGIFNFDQVALTC